MSNWLERTELLIGSEALKKLNNSNILVVGLGGVGSYAAETLVRAGVGNITIIDGDIVDTTNKNRQLQALDSSEGKKKASVLKDRFLDINKDINITVYEEFLTPEAMEKLLQENKYDYVLDCIDSISPKLSLVVTLHNRGSKFISSMGAGGKLNPSMIKIADIKKTHGCKFAQQVRKQLKGFDIRTGFKAVFSDEVQIGTSLKLTDGTNYKKSFYGTIAYMPAMFGMTMAAEVIKQLMDVE